MLALLIVLLMIGASDADACADPNDATCDAPQRSCAELKVLSKEAFNSGDPDGRSYMCADSVSDGWGRLRMKNKGKING